MEMRWRASCADRQRSSDGTAEAQRGPPLATGTWLRPTREPRPIARQESKSTLTARCPFTCCPVVLLPSPNVVSNAPVQVDCL
eukprot:6176321-Pleurochrysis_carterae.AAC.4